MPESLKLSLPNRDTAIPKTAFQRWFASGGSLSALDPTHQLYPWYKVLWLTGVDYFSTLGYQPGIALLAAGALAPIATAILVLITLFGVYPVYAEVAKRSYAGQGSIALLENLLKGWWSKIFVLILIGFAATDFIITITLSAADAAHHAIENPFLKPYLDGADILVTLALLTLLSLVFLKGFKEAIGLAMAVAVPYLALNAIIVFTGLVEIVSHPTLLSQWRGDLFAVNDWTGILVASVLVFPRLALGLSGFETGVSVMPLISHYASGSKDSKVRGLGRLRGTRKLLISAALIMSFLLLSSSAVTTLLIPAEAYQKGGPASGRALAYLAHQSLGDFFGTLYDLSTILILWFAGASAMAGLLNLIPRYLPRFGMAPYWISFRRPLVVVLFAISAVVTWVFKADVEAQGGAYATGVLVLILSAAVAVTIAHWNEYRSQNKRTFKSLMPVLYFGAVAVILIYTTIDNIIERPDGVFIASIFIVGIIVLGGISRQKRSTELRVKELTLTDAESAALFQSLRGKKVHLVPLATNTEECRERKAKELRKHYRIAGPMAFTHINLVDNRSEFISQLTMKVTREGENYIFDVNGAIAIANSIAFISELIDPISIFVGLTRQNLMGQALKYLLFGEGETGLMTYTILLRYWQWTPEEDVRPLIFLMSE